MRHRVRAPGCQPHLRPDVVDDRYRGAGEQGDPLGQGLGEVDLAPHRTFGDVGDSFGAAGVVGQQFDDLILDQGRVDIEHDESAAEAVQADRLDRQVDARLTGSSGHRRS